ncbi:MAG: FkbM family methyltransferase [Rhodospirillales bacterium]|nr:FkbM family methyltransferase [Rhodospirillales bacterium]
MPIFAKGFRIVRRIFRERPQRQRGPSFKFLKAAASLDDFHAVLDVGANVGNMTALFLQQFPNAKVWAFEPVCATCAALRARFANEPRVEIRQEALGCVHSTAPMLMAGMSTTMYRIVDHVDPIRDHEQVTVNTGDGFMAEVGLSAVDFLKIDTEGHDLKVLMGFTAALERKAIRFLQVEAGMNATNSLHVPIQQFMQFLEPLGYHLYRVVGQVAEVNGPGILRRADLVFWRGS